MSGRSFDRHLAEHLSDADRRRRYAQNSAIIDVAVALNQALELSGKTQKDLAVRLGKTEGFVSQVLSGGTNITLRTLGDFAWGLDCTIDLTLKPTSWVFESWLNETWKAPEVQRSDSTDIRLAIAA